MDAADKGKLGAQIGRKAFVQSLTILAVLMVVAAVVLFGLFSYGRLDLALLPDLNYPTLTVRTEFAGA